MRTNSGIILKVFNPFALSNGIYWVCMELTGDLGEVLTHETFGCCLATTLYSDWRGTFQAEMSNAIAWIQL